MIIFELPVTFGIVDRAEAAKWAEAHCILSKKDLRAIGRFCKAAGLYEQLKKVGALRYDIVVREDHASIDALIRAVRKSARAKTKRKKARPAKKTKR